MKRSLMSFMSILVLVSVMSIALSSDNIPAQNLQAPLSYSTTIQPRAEGRVAAPANVSSEANLDCMLIDFEGMGDDVPIGTVPGTAQIPNVVFGSSWLSLVDYDAGGSGNFANEPSPSTTAYYLDQNDISITFDAAVQVVEFYYSAAANSIPVTVTALDADGNLVRKCVGYTIGNDYDGAACSGDPDGNFCCWDKISLASTSNNIRRISIAGTVSNYFGIDNLRVCIGECAPPEGEYPLHQEMPIADSCCWSNSGNCIEVRNLPGTSTWDDCLLGRIEAESGEKVEVWCVAGPEACWVEPWTSHYEFRYFFPSGENYMVGACWFYGGQNAGRVFYADNDLDGKPDCFIRTTWLNLDGGEDDDKDGKVDWWFFDYDVVNNSLTKTHYESSDGPGGFDPDVAVQVDPALGPETEAFFGERIAEYEQTVTPEEGPMGAYPYEPCDLNRDGTCSDSDFQIFQEAFGSCIGDTNFNSFADFNGDCCVTIEDQELLFPGEMEVPADINHDRSIDYKDLAILGAHYGEIGIPPYPPWDINHDGVIDYKDLAILGAHYGEAY